MSQCVVYGWKESFFAGSMSQCVVYGWKESFFALDELLNICCYTCDLNTIDTLFEWSAANGHVFSSKGEDDLEIKVLAMARLPLHGLAMFGLLFWLAIEYKAL